MRATSIAVVLLSARLAAAADGGTEASDEALEKLHLDELLNMTVEDLMNTKVTTATKTSVASREAPAMVEVIDQEQIRLRGYRYLADVLNDLPSNHVDRS